MKKTILTASLLLANYFFSEAQIFASANTGDNHVCYGTQNCQPGNQLNTSLNGVYEFNGSEPISDYDRYMKKSRNRNTAGWLVFSGGALCLVIGGIPTINGLFQSGGGGEGAAYVAGIGALVSLSSIPLFVSSHRNKRKARLIISNQKTGFGIPSKYGKELTGVTVSIPIGR